MTNKKGDKTGDKERMKGDKADTVTNKKGDKKGDKRKQKGDKADTVTNKKGDKRDKPDRRWTRADTFRTGNRTCLGRQRPHGRQMNRNAA